MLRNDRGERHICPQCATKYYDLKKESAICPKCGARPVVDKKRKAGETGKSNNRTLGLRYP